MGHVAGPVTLCPEAQGQGFHGLLGPQGSGGAEAREPQVTKNPRTERARSHPSGRPTPQRLGGLAGRGATPDAVLHGIALLSHPGRFHGISDSPPPTDSHKGQARKGHNRTLSALRQPWRHLLVALRTFTGMRGRHCRKGWCSDRRGRAPLGGQKKAAATQSEQGKCAEGRRARSCRRDR